MDVISKLFAEVFATTEVQTAAVNLLAELCKDPVVLKSIIEMLITVFQRAEIEKVFYKYNESKSVPLNINGLYQ